jgi:hypothetical protein
MFYEFLYPSLIMLLIIYELQSLIKAIVCANFIKRGLLMSDREKDVKK